MLHYCKRCGRIAQEEYNKSEQKCDYCNSVMQYVPEQFLIGKRGIAINDTLKEEFINKYIKSSPEFDQYLFEHRDQDLYNRRVQNAAKMTHGKAILEEKSKTPKCPTCQSTKIRKMSGLETSTSVALFGLFSRKINKTFKCNQCGHTW